MDVRSENDMTNKMNAYFFNGEFHKCYAEAKKYPNDETARKYVQLLEQYDYDKYPQPNAPFLTAQSVERADETYLELDELKDIRSIQEEHIFQARIKMLENMANTGTSDQQAQSFFTQGYLFLYAHQYNESVHCFERATKHNPNKAIYWDLQVKQCIVLGGCRLTH